MFFLQTVTCLVDVLLQWLHLTNFIRGYASQNLGPKWSARLQLMSWHKGVRVEMYLHKSLGGSQCAFSLVTSISLYSKTSPQETCNINSFSSHAKKIARPNWTWSQEPLRMHRQCIALAALSSTCQYDIANIPLFSFTWWVGYSSHSESKPGWAMPMSTRSVEGVNLVLQIFDTYHRRPQSCALETSSYCSNLSQAATCCTWKRLALKSWWKWSASDESAFLICLGPHREPRVEV